MYDVSIIYTFFFGLEIDPTTICNARVAKSSISRDPHLSIHVIEDETVHDATETMQLTLIAKEAELQVVRTSKNRSGRATGLFPVLWSPSLCSNV